MSLNPQYSTRETSALPIRLLGLAQLGTKFLISCRRGHCSTDSGPHVWRRVASSERCGVWRPLPRWLHLLKALLLTVLLRTRDGQRPRETTRTTRWTRIARGYQGLARVTRGYQGLSVVARGCQGLLGVGCVGPVWWCRSCNRFCDTLRACPDSRSSN